MPAQWTTDPILESKLRGMGAEFELVRGISLRDVDVYGSRKNNARLSECWREELSIEYAIALNDGDVFPAPAFRKVGQGYFVLSGNHRVGAALILEDGTIDAYVVGGTDEMVFDFVTRAANRWMGDRQSKDEAVMHARELMRRYNKTQQDMAKLFGLKPAWLSAALRAEECRDALERHAINSREMPRATILQLAMLFDSEPAFKRAGFLASRYKMPAERVKEMVADVRGTRTEADAMAALGRHEEQLKAATAVSAVVAPVARNPGKARLMQALNGLFNFVYHGNGGNQFETAEQMGITSADDRSAVRERLKSVRVLERLLADAQTRYENRKRHKQR